MDYKKFIRIAIQGQQFYSSLILYQMILCLEFNIELRRDGD